MKKIYITLGLLVCLSSFAQNKDTEKADNFFNTYQYTSAIKEYEALVKDKKASVYVYKQLGDSYYHIFNMDKAAQYYAQAVRRDQITDPETYFNYAQVLRTQGKHDEANTQMNKFASMAPDDQRAKEHKANPNYMANLQSKPQLFEVAEAKINKAGSSDFGAVLGKDNILYFASNRGGKTDKRGTGESYLDIYQSVYSADGTLSEPTSVSALNTSFHDGPTSISADGNTMFFSRDGRAEGSVAKDKDANARIGKVGIYRAQKKDGKWTNITAVPFNSTKYNVGNPSLSKDGKTLYFASDMPGGMGGTDIWKVTINSNGRYGKPENLGSSVNTSGRESFPFIADDGTLYFASNGRQGFGGLDIFMLEQGTSQAVNVGAPVNSAKDDFAFTFNQDIGVGFVSSNRAGQDDIYYVNPICAREAIVIVKDAKTLEVLSGANVAILDDKKATLSSARSNNQGRTNFHTECNKAYSLQASLSGYEPNTVALAAAKAGQTTTEILLTPIEVIITPEEVVLNPVFFEFDKSNITEQGARELDRLVKVMRDNYPEMVIFVRAHTDTKGSDSYNMALSERRAQSTVQYIISKGIDKDRITGKGFGESEPKVDCKEDCTEEEDAQNRRSEFIIVSGGPTE